MSEKLIDPVVLPTDRTRPFDPPDDLAWFRDEAPIRPLRYPDGHIGWLVTGHQAARAILSDPRFSNRPEGKRSARQEIQQLFPTIPGFFMMSDPPEHTRFRKLLTGQFTVRRMNQLAPRIEQIVAERLDAMESNGAPADLVGSFALPIPSLVICELLGVPYADRRRFQHNTKTFFTLDTTPEERTAAITDLLAQLRELILVKRETPEDDLISGLVESGELTDEELAGAGILLLIGGHETTANMLALGSYALLSHPAQLASLRADPALVPGAVEELLRHLTIIQSGLQRVALEDVELDGLLIKAGQSVAVLLPAANRDPERFAEPDLLDITRDAGGHLAFGHGIHQCLGQQLARIEMRIGYRALFDRFPDLRLAVPPEEIPLRTDMGIYGVHMLPVTW